MPRQSKNQATTLMDELKTALKHRLETLNRIYQEAVDEKNFETIAKCDVEFKNINEQINSFPETKNLVKDCKMEEEFKILTLFFKNVAEGCVDLKSGKCVKGKKAPVKKVEKKEESDSSDSESSDDESEEEKKPAKAKKVTVKKPVKKVEKEEKKEEKKVVKRKAPAKATDAKPVKKAPVKKAKKEESDSESSDSSCSDSSDYSSDSDSSDSTDSEDELEFEFYDDLSKIRKFEKQAKAGTITGKQAEEKCKKLILAMPKKYRTLTGREIKSTIKDLLANI